MVTYWPEFGHAGKEAITVRQLLEHEAASGPGGDRPTSDLTTVMIPTFSARCWPAQRPAWPPGSARGYHAQSLGWYESQLLRRVDPAGRTIGRFFAEEVAGPLGVEFFIGLPRSVPRDRVATFVGGSKLGMARHGHEVPFPLSCGGCSTPGA
ncbi:MAG: serine hydrolase domain-containing protein [Acidimicrobiales bacterium]